MSHRMSGFSLGGVLALAIAWLPSPLSAQQINVTVNEGTSIAVAMSPDRLTLAFDLQGGIWTLPASGGTARRITDIMGDARQPAWSPDGGKIAFQSYRDGNFHLWSVNRDGGGLKQLTFGPYDDREPHWSHDGTRLVFSSDRNGTYDVWVLDLESSELEAVTGVPGHEYMPSWSPDDRRIAFVAEQEGAGSIRVLELGGGQQVVARVGGRAAGPSWSADGTRLLFNRIRRGSDSRLFLADVGPGRRSEPRAVTQEDEDVFPFRATWISETEFIYTADGHIKRGSIDSPRTDIIEFEATFSFTRPAYVKRGRDFDSTDPRPVRGIITPAVAPAGDAIAFVALSDLWVMRVGENPMRLTEDRLIEMDPAWSPDGSQLVYAGERAGTMDLWLRNMTDGSERRLTELSGVETAPAWSPDGLRIAFVDGQGQIQVVEVATGVVTQLHDALFRPGRPTWLSDSRRIAVSVLRRYSSRFREGRNEVLITSLDGRPARYVNPVPHWSIGTRGTDGPVLSPDGHLMAFVSDGVLWVVSVDHDGEPIGPPRLVANELADTPTWTGDSRTLVFQGVDGLRKASLDDGVIEDIEVNLQWQPTRPTGRVVVHAGRVFDGQSSSYRRDVDIVIEGNRIREIVAHRSELHRGEVVDAGSETVMPGLLEMHTHQRQAFGEALGRVWLSYGITAVREPVANPYQALERRESIESGLRVGPREFFTGGTFDGSRIYYSGGSAMKTGPHVEMELQRAKTLGYDMIKTYVRLPDNLQQRVIEFAHANGIPVSSHELFPAVAFGADGVEHIGGTSRRGYSPKVTALNRTYEDVIQLLGQSGMSITPTIGIMGGFNLAVTRDPSIADDPRIRTLFPTETLEEDIVARAARTRGGVDRLAARIAPMGETVRRVIEAGGRVIAGTDSPIIPPGISLHTELEHFVDAGLSPFQALQSATIEAAAWLGVEQELGSLEVGKLADLVIVDGDPLQNIRDARRVRIVIKNGVVYRLDDLLRPPIL